jgi:hypothetical protein
LEETLTLLLFSFERSLAPHVCEHSADEHADDDSDAQLLLLFSFERSLAPHVCEHSADEHADDDSDAQLQQQQR